MHRATCRHWRWSSTRFLRLWDTSRASGRVSSRVIKWGHIGWCWVRGFRSHNEVTSDSLPSSKEKIFAGHVGGKFPGLQGLFVIIFDVVDVSAKSLSHQRFGE